jgi:hypothetical protein
MQKETTFIQSKLLPLIPLTGNVAADAMNKISLSDGKELKVRMTAWVMPLFLAIATIQETGAFLAHTVLYLTGKEKINLIQSGTVAGKLAIATVLSLISFFPALTNAKVFKRNEMTIEKIAKLPMAEANSFLQLINVNLHVMENTNRKNYLYEPKLDEEPSLPIIDDPFNFIYLDGMYCMTAKGLSSEQLIVLINELPNALEGLILDNCQIEDLLDQTEKIENNKLNQLKVLAIKGVNSIPQGVVNKFKTKIPSIVAFDLTGVSVNGGVSLEIQRNCIVLSSGYNNAQDHLNDLNKTFIDGIIQFNQDKDEDELITLFNGVQSPAANFVTNLSFLRGLDLSEKCISAIIDHLSKKFKNLIELDFSNLANFSVQTLVQIGKRLKLKALRIKECKNAYKVKNETSEWKPDSDNFQTAIGHLFFKGLTFLDTRQIKSTTVQRAFEAYIFPSLNVGNEIRFDVQNKQKDWSEVGFKPEA